MGYKKPIPALGSICRYSNKKYKSPRSGQLCRVLVTSRRNAGVHNCLVAFEDGELMVVSKWNLLVVSKWNLFDA